MPERGTDGYYNKENTPFDEPTANDWLVVWTQPVPYYCKGGDDVGIKNGMIGSFSFLYGTKGNVEQIAG